MRRKEKVGIYIKMLFLFSGRLVRRKWFVRRLVVNMFWLSLFIEVVREVEVF